MVICYLSGNEMCFSNHGLRFVSAPSYLRLVIWPLNFCAIVTTIVIALEAAFLLISVVLMFTVNMCCILWILRQIKGYQAIKLKKAFRQ
jgi:uncharacterized membrane protein